jgi:BirA family biotin operon repressor/biotin-[acetyl-CoA-carboxylase] ligase
VPRLGLLSRAAVRFAVARELGRDIEFHESLPSTQDRARRLAAEGATAGVVVADEQRAGQGTHGRVWLAAAGTSLLASWITRPAPASPALVAALSGVAVARSLEALGFAGTHVKWPNDVQLGGKKIAGALAHATSDGSGGTLVLGIGVNVHQRVADFPLDLRGSATSLAIAGHPVDRLALLARLSAELDRLREPAELERARAEWRERSAFLGRTVAVTVSGRPPLHGTATAIDDEGALLVTTASGVERVIAGEVRVE